MLRRRAAGEGQMEGDKEQESQGDMKERGGAEQEQEEVKCKIRKLFLTTKHSYIGKQLHRRLFPH